MDLGEGAGGGTINVFGNDRAVWTVEEIDRVMVVMETLGKW